MSVDLTVTSPPYDNLRTYNGNNALWCDHVWKAVIQELYRLTKQCGVVVWIVNDAVVNGSETGTSFRQALCAMECGFNLHDTMIYQKNGCPYPDKRRYFNSFEYMFVWSKGIVKTVNLITDKKNNCYGDVIKSTQREKDGSISKSHTVRNNLNRTIKEYGVRNNIWSYSTGKNKTTKDDYAYEHPAMFPEQLANDHIISWSNEGDTILDPFMGSGTTGKMAILNNRKFIGIEIDPIYFEIAKKRISEAEKEAQYQNSKITLDSLFD